MTFFVNKPFYHAASFEQPRTIYRTRPTSHYM